MTTIQIAYEVSAEKFREIKDFLSKVAVNDCNWNGTTFNVERDDFTCIPDDDSADAVSLLIEIQSIINE